MKAGFQMAPHQGGGAVQAGVDVRAGDVELCGGLVGRKVPAVAQFQDLAADLGQPDDDLAEPAEPLFFLSQRFRVRMEGFELVLDNGKFSFSDWGSREPQSGWEGRQVPAEPVEGPRQPLQGRPRRAEPLRKTLTIHSIRLTPGCSEVPQFLKRASKASRGVLGPGLVRVEVAEVVCRSTVFLATNNLHWLRILFLGMRSGIF